MLYRDSSQNSMHLLNGAAASVESSHGVVIYGGSTGGFVESIGDDANISVTVRGKGTGGVTIGNSSQTVTIGGGTAFKGYKSDTGTTQFAAISSGQTLEVPLSTAVTNVNAGDLATLETIITPTTVMFSGYRIDSDVTTRVTMVVGNPGSTASSTGRVSWRIVYADLT